MKLYDGRGSLGRNGNMLTPVYKFSDMQSFKKRPSTFDLHSHVYPLEGEQQNKPNGDTFQGAIAGTLGMARVLLLFPVHGIFGQPKDLRFKLKGVLSILSFLATLPSLWIAVVAAAFAIKSLSKMKGDSSGSVVNKMAGCIFYLNAWTSALLLRGIARGWPKLQAGWRFEEIRANVIKAPPLKVKLAITATILMTLAVAEHWLSVLYKTSHCRAAIKAGNSSFYECLSEYCLDSHSFVFQMINYNAFLGIVIVLTSEVATFTWNYQDLFLIQISFALRSRFKHINWIVDGLDIQVLGSSDWKAIRELYCGCLQLTRETSSLLSKLVLLSFANNLFFICLQMFNGLTPSKDDLVYKIYFYGSFGFLVGRVTSVALSAAAIPLEYKKHLSLFRCCPSVGYCHEVHRLLQQLVNDEVSLSGMGFFTVNRNFMLGVIGAVATYEIVLLQMS